MSEAARPVVGIVVNPVAGIGGTAGLKGSDGEEIVRQAREAGATSPAQARAQVLLDGLRASGLTHMVAGPGPLGADHVIAAGITPQIVDVGEITVPTSAADTRKVVRAMSRHPVDILLFVGGDGTARDVLAAVDNEVPVLGVPSGVKMHSAVFAATPRRAVEIVTGFVAGVTRTSLREVMDSDESALRAGRVSARLHGMLRVPDDPRNLQSAKAPSRLNDDVDGIADEIVSRCGPDACYVLGPGTTAATVARHLGVDGSLLGVDVVEGGRVLALDVDEPRLFELVAGRRPWIVLGITGGQGFVLGRGNQQISPRVVTRVGLDRLVVAATPGKLAALAGSVRVDTGDVELDKELSGYRRIVTGFRRDTMWNVES